MSWEISDSIAITSAIIAGISAIFAGMSSRNSTKMHEENKDLTVKLANRSAVNEVMTSWKGISNIDPNKLITPDVINAVNALAITSAYWEHEIVTKEVIYDLIWQDFKRVYSQLDSAKTTIPPRHDQTIGDMIRDQTTRVYNEMLIFKTGK